MATTDHSERLNSARQLHTILVLTSMVVLAFALSSTAEKRYRSASEELRTLKELDWREVIAVMDSTLILSEPPFGFPLDGVPSSAAHWQVKVPALSERYPKISSYQGLFPSVFDVPESGEPLQAYKDKLELRMSVLRLVCECPGESLLFSRLDRFDFASFDSAALHLKFRGKQQMPPPLLGKTGCRFFRHEFLDVVADSAVVGIRLYQGGGYMETGVSPLRKLSPWWVFPPAGPFVALVSPNLARMTKEGRIVALPALAKVWTAVRSKSVADADSLLDAKIEASAGQWSVLGFSVDSQSMGWMGPGLLLVIQLLFLLHLKNLPESAFESAESAWIGLFSDGLSRGATVVSTTLFPIVAAIAALVRSEQLWLAWLLPMGAAVVSLGVVRQLLRAFKTIDDRLLASNTRWQFDKT
jgi:hypothetical protein